MQRLCFLTFFTGTLGFSVPVPLHAARSSRVPADAMCAQREPKPKPRQGVQQVLCNRLFVVSTANADISQRELSSLITLHGGRISPTCHKRCHFLVTTEQAVRQQTQAVRKACARGLTLVTPAFVLDSISSGGLCNPQEYAPPKEWTDSFRKE